MSEWYVCIDDSLYFKTHAIDASFEEEILEYAAQRSDTFEKSDHCRRTADWFFEPCGYGMYYNNQPRMDFTVGGKKLTLDAAKVSEMIFELSNAEERELGGRTIYKVYSRFHVICFTAEEREELKAQLLDRQFEADELADEFFERANQAWEQQKQEYEEETGQEYPILRSQDLMKEKN